jgi:hypothetical protein
MRLLRTRKTPPEQPRIPEGADWVDREIASLHEVIREERSRAEVGRSADAEPPLPRASGRFRKRRRRQGRGPALPRPEGFVRTTAQRVGVYSILVAAGLMLGWLAVLLVNVLAR